MPSLGDGHTIQFEELVCSWVYYFFNFEWAFQIGGEFVVFVRLSNGLSPLKNENPLDKLAFLG